MSSPSPKLHQKIHVTMVYLDGHILTRTESEHDGVTYRLAVRDRDRWLE